MNRLKELRKERGLLQKELADILGVHYRTIQNWENGGYIKSDKTQEIADYFGVDVGYLLGFNSERHVSSRLYANLTIENNCDGNGIKLVFTLSSFGELIGVSQALYQSGVKWREDCPVPIGAFDHDKMVLVLYAGEMYLRWR